MADAASILLLMEHAADRLDEEHGRVVGAFHSLIHYAGSADRIKHESGLASYVAASTYAATVLRMVAMFMAEAATEDGTPEGSDG